MSIRIDQVRNALQNFDFKTLFVEELGWDHHSGSLDIQMDGLTYQLRAIAHKQGMAVYLCPTPPDRRMPNYPTRRKIDRQVTKTCHEHFIIYFDADQTHQIWQWVKREPRKPSACREHAYYRGHTGEALAQRLSNIAFTLEEEEELTVVTVAGRAQAAFDVERITRRFYDYFKDEHASFLKFLEGIPDEQMKRWYVSVMLNRLMFIYFIQKKGFLDEDRDYLRNKLAQSRDHGNDRFYREFLCPLFFEGFAKRPQNRSAETNRLLGKVPYLNGGLFLKHQIEELHGEKIQIPDSAFERVFDFFDRYRWHLDERPLRHDDEINPDVLGYIFEKYINQKQMGAYYTKEDITGYISRNTVVPFLFDAAKKKCKVAFEPDQYIWKILQTDPDRYIYPAVRHGITCDIRETPPQSLEKPAPLPPEIEAGIKDVSKRGGWNKTAPPDAGLPTEIWREVIARWQRYQGIRDKLTAGEVEDINDLITLNLDIEQFAQDVIENCEGPELLRAFWQAIEKMTVLDPTCGSGAFLFAALNILETLYEACIDRMQAFVDELDRSGEKHRPEKFSDFRKILEQIDKHPSRKYFIYKSIVINNLYGVDIMEEAIEICKLRLFLKLVAQVDRVEDIEPLPDIDFNIRAGNTLVGYATYDQVRKAVTSKLDFDNAMQRIEGKASDVEHLSSLFRQQQTELGGTVTATDKKKLRSRLASLEDELNHYLASEYEIDPAREDEYEEWLSSHRPFHWFIDFYSIMKSGGFDVIIGNPPYVQYKAVKDTYQVRGYATLDCKDLYAYTTERAYALVSNEGRVGLIVPISIFGVDGFSQLQRESCKRLGEIWVSSYANRPAQLFDGAQKRLTIVLGRRSEPSHPQVHTTAYLRWKKEEFPTLFATRVCYAPLHQNFSVFPASLEKLGSSLDTCAFAKLTSSSSRLDGAHTTVSKHCVYYTRKFGYFLCFLDFVPSVVEMRTGRQVPPSELKDICFATKETVLAVVAALSSSTFFWFWNVLSDCRNLNRRDILAFPLDPEILSVPNRACLAKLGNEYLEGLKRSSREMQKSGLRIQTFEYASTKPILDQVDAVLAEHYGFTDEELDFIINYDIKYRLGLNSED